MGTHQNSAKHICSHYLHSFELPQFSLYRALTPLLRALQLLLPLTDKQDSPPLQHYCWSRLLHTPHTEAQLWIWNGTLGGCEIPFPHHHNDIWGLSWPLRLRTTSEFLCTNMQQEPHLTDCVDIVCCER